MNQESNGSYRPWVVLYRSCLTVCNCVALLQGKRRLELVQHMEREHERLDELEWQRVEARRLAVRQGRAPPELE